MIFKDGDISFEMRLDASSFVAYLASLGFDFVFKNGMVELEEDDVFFAILVGVISFGKSGAEHPNKNLVFLMTRWLNKEGALEKLGMEKAKQRYCSFPMDEQPYGILR